MNLPFKLPRVAHDIKQLCDLVGEVGLPKYNGNTPVRDYLKQVEWLGSTDAYSHVDPQQWKKIQKLCSRLDQRATELSSMDEVFRAVQKLDSETTQDFVDRAELRMHAAECVRGVAAIDSGLRRDVARHFVRAMHATYGADTLRDFPRGEELLEADPLPDVPRQTAWDRLFELVGLAGPYPNLELSHDFLVLYGYAHQRLKATGDWNHPEVTVELSPADGEVEKA